MKDGDIKTINEASSFLRLSVSKIRLLMNQKKIGYYGKKSAKKLFSVEKHLIPYLESIENPPVLTRKPKEKQKRLPSSSYTTYRTGVFDKLV